MKQLTLLRRVKRDDSRGFVGHFRLPESFDTNKFAAAWVEKSRIAEMTQEQPVVGTPYMAPGWTLYRNSENEKYSIQSGGTEYFLMLRPKAVQDQVNEAYGQLSRQRLNQEVVGEQTSAGSDGMLTNKDMDKVIGQDDEIRPIQDTRVNPVLSEPSIKTKKRKI